MSGKIDASARRPVQVKRVHDTGWTKAKRKRFLDVLAGSCNVRIAAAAVGMGTVGAYRLRRRDPAFAELWKEALSTGYEVLEEALLHRALVGVNAIEIEPALDAIELADSDGGPVRPASGFVGKPATQDVQLALTVLNRHRATVEGMRTLPAGRRPTEEETNAALRKQLDILARKLRAAEE